jgi:hypothetical protein
LVISQYTIKNPKAWVVEAKKLMEWGFVEAEGLMIVIIRQIY